MRLLDCSNDKLSLTKDFSPRDIPSSYAILSHTWGADTEEVTYRDLGSGGGQDKPGYDKIRFCAEQATRDGLRYFWVDTCCIDKSNHTELNEAINSMFSWYKSSTRCYVYLSDVPGSTYENEQQADLALRASRWFTRGWTLQELLAPSSVEFFTKSGRRLGDKRSLERQIHEITDISISALRGDALSGFSSEERLGWAKGRQTSREEDWAYSLLGIFNVFMPLIYGEGKENAVCRLRKEVETYNKVSISQDVREAIWMVPFERNPSFTSRDTELTRLRQTLFKGGRTTKVAITGLGGVGKTQLALELAYRTRAEHKDCSVVWIPVTSKESFSQAYLNVARQLRIPGWEDDKADIKKLVQAHLSSAAAGQWLLIFDNADDISIWIDKSTTEYDRLIDCLPKSRLGSIIFTTRDKKVAVKLAGREVVDIPEIDEAGGRHLLQCHIIDQDNLSSDENVAALLNQLTHLPLAVVQAAAYINENSLSLQDYLSLLDEQEEEVIGLLSQDFEDEGRYHEIKNPVATTWLISFERIRQTNPLAAEYLSLMACVEAKNIPRSLLPPGPSRKEEIDAMGTLRGYSFISQQHAESALTIHRLVHLAMRNWLRKEGLLLPWATKVVSRFKVLLLGVEHYNREVWRSFMPHMYYALKSNFLSEDASSSLGLLRLYGICLYQDGRYLEAKEIYRILTEIRQALLGGRCWVRSIPPR